MQLNHVPQEIMSLKTIFAEGVTVLKVMRRFGCPLARLEAMEISSRHDEFTKLGVNLVGVGFDVPGMSEFILGNFWKGRLFVDPSRSLYKHLDLPRVGIKSTLKCLASSKIRDKFSLAKEKTGGDMKGDSFQLGGTFVINHRSELLYSFVQTEFTSKPNINEILNVCKLYTKQTISVKKNNFPRFSLPSAKAPKKKRLSQISPNEIIVSKPNLNIPCFN